MLLNRVVPLGVLLVDFMYNCVPFIMRHYLPYSLLYLCMILEHLVQDPKQYDYHMFVYNEQEVGFVVPILFLILSLLIYGILVKVSKMKLRLFDKKEALEQLEYMYYQLKLEKRSSSRLSLKSRVTSTQN